MNSLLHIKRQCPTSMDRSFVQQIEYIFGGAAQQVNNSIGANRWSGHVEKDGGYKCINLDIYDFLTSMQLAIKHLKLTGKQRGEIKFIDVGCGVGEKVYLADMLGFDAYGLELRDPLIKRAMKLFHALQIFKSEPFFLQGNALKFTEYSDYDIIYFYCPLFDIDLEKQMEKRIAVQGKSGALVIGHLSKYFMLEPHIKGWKKLGGALFQ